MEKPLQNDRATRSLLLFEAFLRLSELKRVTHEKKSVSILVEAYFWCFVSNSGSGDEFLGNIRKFEDDLVPSILLGEYPDFNTIVEDDDELHFQIATGLYGDDLDNVSSHYFDVNAKLKSTITLMQQKVYKQVEEIAHKI